MTDLSFNPPQCNKLALSLLESLFNAKIEYIAPGQVSKTTHGTQLEEFQFCSTWTDVKKLIKDIHQIVGKQVWPVVNPDIGCKLILRGIVTERVEDKNYTSFIFSVDPLGYVAEEKPAGYFSPEDVVIGMIESTGTHTINVAENEIPKDRNGKELRVIETSFAWYGITELQTRASQFIFGLANAYEQSATIYILDHKTTYHDQPKRNVTSLKYAIAHPEF